jgi:hypothetical protein
VELTNDQAASGFNDPLAGEVLAGDDGSDYSDGRPFSFSLMRVQKCNACAFCIALGIGQLVTRPGPLIVNVKKERLPKLDYRKKGLLFMDARMNLLASSQAEAFGFLESCRLLARR